MPGGLGVHAGSREVVRCARTGRGPGARALGVGSCGMERTSQASLGPASSSTWVSQPRSVPVPQIPSTREVGTERKEGAETRVATGASDTRPCGWVIWWEDFIFLASPKPPELAPALSCWSQLGSGILALEAGFWEAFGLRKRVQRPLLVPFPFLIAPRQNSL